MFKKFKALVENEIGRKIKKLRANNGLEFVESEFDELCEVNRIARHKNLVGKPQQNGVTDESIGLYWRKLDVCFPMRGFGIQSFLG